MTSELTDEQRAIAQAYVDQSFERFKDIVRSGRPVFRQDPEALDQLATGEIFAAPQAKTHGLIDELGFVEEAIDRAIELAGLNKDQVRVVEYERPVGLFDVSLFAGEGVASDWQVLLELSVPRAYYLTSTLPVLAASRERTWRAE